MNHYKTGQRVKKVKVGTEDVIMCSLFAACVANFAPRLSCVHINKTFSSTHDRPKNRSRCRRSASQPEAEGGIFLFLLLFFPFFMSSSCPAGSSCCCERSTPPSLLSPSLPSLCYNISPLKTAPLHSLYGTDTNSRDNQQQQHDRQQLLLHVAATTIKESA